MNVPRLALVSDYPEEGWPSMDLCAEMLALQLQSNHADRFNVHYFCPPFNRRLTKLPLLGNRAVAANADRLYNRLWCYPRALRKFRDQFDLFHLCDHSYAHLVHTSGERTGVFCHDLDTFRCLLHPSVEPRPRWFKSMVKHILHGFQKAAIVFHTTQAVRQDILKHGLIDASRLVQAPLGVAQEFQPQILEPDPAATQLASLNGRPFLLHVGSCIPRKRIDVLLDVFAAIRLHCPDLQLVKVGGQWSPSQREQIDRLRLDTALHHLRGVDRLQLASLYRHARMVLITSDSEGFGIPVIEALACGALTVASDIAPLHEAGGSAVVYAPVGDVLAWTEIIRHLLESPGAAPGPSDRSTQAEKFSWSKHANIIADAYTRLKC